MPAAEVQNFPVSQCLFPASQKLLKPNTAPTPIFSSVQNPASTSEPVLPTLQLILRCIGGPFWPPFPKAPLHFLQSVRNLEYQMMHGGMQLVLVFIFSVSCLCFILFNIYFPKYTQGNTLFFCVHLDILINKKQPLKQWKIFKERL